MQYSRDQQYPVSERALVQRINRERAPYGQRLRKKRSRDRGYYLIHEGTRIIIEERVDLEEMGRQLGVLQESERLTDEDAEDPDG